MATLYRAYYNTENGSNRDFFFRTSTAARDFVRTTVPGVEYAFGQYFINGSFCDVCEFNELDYYLKVSAPADDNNNEYHCGVESFELPFEIKDDKIWALSYVRGYTSCMDGLDEQPKVLGYFPDEESAKRYAVENESTKNIAKVWIIDGEDARKIDCPLNGGDGEDYLRLYDIPVSSD